MAYEKAINEANSARGRIFGSLRFDITLCVPKSMSMQSFMYRLELVYHRRCRQSLLVLFELGFVDAVVYRLVITLWIENSSGIPSPIY